MAVFNRYWHLLQDVFSASAFTEPNISRDGEKIILVSLENSNSLSGSETSSLATALRQMGLIGSDSENANQNSFSTKL